MIARRPRAALGVGISSDAVRAVLLCDGAAAWTREIALDVDRSLREALDTLASEATSRARVRRAVFAVGPAAAQLRRLHRLPAVRDASVLAAIVQENVGRYFRQSSVPIRTTPPADWREDSAWVGAIEAPIVEAVGAACRSARIPTASVAPAAALLGHAAPGSRIVRLDGDIALDARYDGTALAECRCVPAFLAETPAEPATLDPALARIGDDASRFVEAFAAARAGVRMEPAIDPMHDGAVGRATSRRLATAAAACVAALLFALAAPLLASMHVERSATARLATVARVAASGDRAARLLTDSTRTLNELAAFQRGGRSMTLLLASLTCAINEPTMLTSLRLDAAGGMLTALTPSAAALLEMLGRVPEVESPTIVGSVTGEAHAGQPLPGIGAAPMQPPPSEPQRALERVTVRFQWRARWTLLGASRVCDE